MRENKQRTHVVSHIVQKAEGGEQSGALRLAGDGAKKIPEAEASGNLLEVTTRFELVDEGFADPCLTTWPRHHIWSEYFHSIWSGRRGSNSLPPPWQGGALPDELRPHIRCICPCTLPSDSCEYRGPRESLRSKILWGRGGISEFVTAVLLVRLPDKRLTFRRSDPDRARTDDPQRDRLVL